MQNNHPQDPEEILSKVFGGKGYIQKALAHLLFDNDVQPFTSVRRNMKQKALGNEEKILRRKRSVIETANDESKNI